MPPLYATTAAPARNRLRMAAAFGAIGATLSGVYAFGGVGIPCPWRFVTHTLCPFCGSTTMGAHLLRGELGSAWAANQFVFLMLIALAIACVAWTVEVLGGPSLRLPRALRDQRFWYAAVAVAAVAFAIVRNLVPLA